MPFTIFSHRHDPEFALQVLRALEPDGVYEAKPEEDGWAMTFSMKESLLKKRKTITVNYSRTWCSPPNWPAQIQGMKNYASQFELSADRMAKLQHVISQLTCTFGMICEPEIEDFASDWRMGLIHLLASEMDGLIFAPGAFLDPDFRPLGDDEGEFDPEAVFPDVPAGSAPAFASVDSPADAPDTQTFKPDPPDEERVVRRLFALALVAGRGVLEMDAGRGDLDDPESAHDQLVHWVEILGVEAELDAEERRLVHARPGKLSQQDTLNCVWRLEGLTVVAWSLGLFDLPPYDECAHTPSLLDAVHFLASDAMEKVRARVSVRSIAERNTLAEQMFAFNWRMTNQRVTPGPVDFVKMQEECWFGPLDLSWARFDGTDLEIGGCGVSEASPEFISLAISIAAERHKAANWLRGDALMYSDAATHT